MTDIHDGTCCPEDSIVCKLHKPEYVCKANPEYGSGTNVGSFYNKQCHQSPFLGLFCPQSHPIPCKDGSMCTDQEHALNPNNCNDTAIAEGQCCPEGAIHCNDERQEYLCRANPNYGENES